MAEWCERRVVYAVVLWMGVSLVWGRDGGRLIVYVVEALGVADENDFGRHVGVLVR